MLDTPQRQSRPVRLTLRKDGRYCARINYKLHYLGKDRDEALIRYAKLRAAMTGKVVVTSPAEPIGDATVKLVADRFLYDRLQRLQDNRLKGGTFDDYYAAVDEFARAAGVDGKPLRGRGVDDLRPEDFALVRAAWAERLGAWALDRHVQAVRSMFNWAQRHRLMSRQPFYGDGFHKSPRKEKRVSQSDRQRGESRRLFTPGEIKTILAAADPSVRAFVLLGLNGGMNAADIGTMQKRDICIEDCQFLIDFDRGKTGVHWKFTLWPETLDAICDAMARRSPYLFLTSHGNPWYVEHRRPRKGKPGPKTCHTNSVALMFGRLLVELGIKRPRVSFGAFRHTHTSATGDHPDKTAARWVRGHETDEIEWHYDFPSVDRLKSVTDHAYTKLMGDLS